MPVRKPATTLRTIRLYTFQIVATGHTHGTTGYLPPVALLPTVTYHNRGTFCRAYLPLAASTLLFTPPHTYVYLPLPYLRRQLRDHYRRHYRARRAF